MLRSDNRVSVVGVDLFCFKILIRFGGLFLDKGASHGGGGGYFNKFCKKYISEHNEHEFKLNVTAINCKHRSHTQLRKYRETCKLLFSLLFCYLCLHFCLG